MSDPTPPKSNTPTNSNPPQQNTGDTQTGEINRITEIPQNAAEKLHRELLSKTPSGRLLTSGKLQPNDPKPRKLNHISEIENPRNAQKLVSVEAIVSSTSRAYTIPSRVKARWWTRDDDLREAETEITAKDPINMALCGANSTTKQRVLMSLFPEARNPTHVEDLESRTVYQLSVRPPVFTLEKRGDKIFDDQGFEYKSYSVYVAADQAITFQASSLMKLTGYIQPDPKTQRTTLLVTQVEFTDQVTHFNREKLIALREVYNGRSHHARLSWAIENFQLYSRIVGRGDIATAFLLGYFTPEYIELGGDRQRGWCNILAVGDTTTGKTENLRSMQRLFQAGSLITAETASAVGLVGAASQNDKGSWSVDWGALVLNDRRLLAVDGAHKLSKAQYAGLAEAERSGVVSIMKAAKETAYARTRQIKIANPLDPDSRRGESRNLSDFMYPVQAVPSFLDYMSIARIDLAVFANSDDVRAEDINRLQRDEYDCRLELLAEALRWVWAGELKIIFAEPALALLHSEATRLYNMFYSKRVPLVSIDLKWKLARLASAAAAICLSTEGFDELHVESEHISFVSSFMEDVYRVAGLHSLASFDREESEVTDEEADEILIEISELIREASGNRSREILNWIVASSRFNKAQLIARFELPENHVVRPLIAYLINRKLIRQGQGFYPTAKLIRLCRLITGIAVITPEKASPPTQRTLASEVV